MTITMTRLLSVSQCPECEKRGKDTRRNNLAEYADGWHCFGCGYRKQKNTIEHHLRRFEGFSTARVCNGITCTEKLLTEHLKWLLSYNLTMEEIGKFKYAYQRDVKGNQTECNILVFIHQCGYWLGRNFSDGGVRYLSSGEKPLITYGSNTDVIVFVEDVISAIKVGRVATAIPMLGARIPTDWLTRCKGYERVIIWGDRDKAVDNVRQSRRCSELLGVQVESIITDLDPKDYETKDIYNYIYNK